MLKENWRFIARLERVADLVLVVISFFAAYYGRSSLLFWNDTLRWELPFDAVLAPVQDYYPVLIVALIAYGLVLQALGAYNTMRFSTAWQLLRTSILTSVYVFLLLAAILFLVKLDLSRTVLALFCTLVALFLTVERYIVLSVLRFWRKRGKNFRNILVCGIGDQAVKIAGEISSRPELGIRIRGFASLRKELINDKVTLNEFKSDLKEHGCARPGRIIFGKEALEKALSGYAVDEVIFTDIVGVMPEVENAMEICSDQGIRTTVVADLFSIGIVKSGLSYFGDMPLIHFQTPPGDRWELSIKRALDIAISLVLLIAILPLLLFIALGVKLTSKGPVIFKQRRLGLNGRLFNLYKFRSMKEGAELELENLRKLNEMSGPVFKMKKDPRITRFGAFLRRFSLDELPQLWNVLMGDMSLVGPRPPVPGEVSLYERKDRRRLSMRPGITCTWQVSGRNDIADFESWVKLDLDYIDNWSLSRDIILLFKTIPAVLIGTGAR